MTASVITRQMLLIVMCQFQRRNSYNLLKKKLEHYCIFDATIVGQVFLPPSFKFTLPMSLLLINKSYSTHFIRLNRMNILLDKKLMNNLEMRWINFSALWMHMNEWIMWFVASNLPLFELILTWYWERIFQSLSSLENCCWSMRCSVTCR